MATAPVERLPLAPPIRAGFDVLELVRLAGDVGRDSPRKPGRGLGELPAWLGPAPSTLAKAWWSVGSSAESPEGP